MNPNTTDGLRKMNGKPLTMSISEEPPGTIAGLCNSVNAACNRFEQERGTSSDRKLLFGYRGRKKATT
jgi:hypothetical protein